jgi:RNA polymerase sigma-70 factor (ECF subfamily)
LYESVQLAFVAAIQHLPPRQRAVLLLRDVLGWSANETAGLLDTSVASANSALQRARATLGKQFPTGQPTALPVPTEQQRALLDRYVRAWEGADLDAFVALLREDATLSMPPWPHWYHGRSAIRAFYRWAWGKDNCGSAGGPRPLGTPDAFRLVPTAANGQPAFAMYRRDPEGSTWHGHAIQVLTLQGAAITAMTAFVRPVGPRLVAAFGLPPTLLPGVAASSPAARASNGGDR